MCVCVCSRGVRGRAARGGGGRAGGWSLVRRPRRYCPRPPSDSLPSSSVENEPSSSVENNRKINWFRGRWYTIVEYSCSISHQTARSHAHTRATDTNTSRVTTTEAEGGMLGLVLKRGIFNDVNRPRPRLSCPSLLTACLSARRKIPSVMILARSLARQSAAKNNFVI